MRDLSPAAEEYVTYNMPALKWHGPLVDYVNFKNHYSLFPMNGRTLSRFTAELADYKTAISTVQFRYGDPLPVDVIRMLVQARIEENLAQVQRPNIQSS